MDIDDFPGRFGYGWATFSNHQERHIADEVKAPGAPPQAQLMQMAMGFMMPMLMRTVTELKVADHLADGPRTADELAGPTGTYAPALYRLLRTMSAFGLFAEDGDGRFTLTALGTPLRADVPGSVRTSILMATSRLFTTSYLNAGYSVRTGKSAFKEQYGMPVFEYLAARPEEGRMFSEFMVGIHGGEVEAVSAAYDFSGFGSIVDIGGATGYLLMAIFGRYAKPRGVVFDLPHNEANALEAVASRGMKERIGFQAGSFFESVPAGHDVYMMSHIIHDWSEEECLTILGNIRKAMAPGSRLLIVEMVLPEGNVFHPGKMLDMVMLIVPGGEERTANQYEALLAKAGFRMERIVPTGSAVSIVEAFPVPA